MSLWVNLHNKNLPRKPCGVSSCSFFFVGRHSHQEPSQKTSQTAHYPKLLLVTTCDDRPKKWCKYSFLPINFFPPTFWGYIADSIKLGSQRLTRSSLSAIAWQVPQSWRFTLAAFCQSHYNPQQNGWEIYLSPRGLNYSRTNGEGLAGQQCTM